MQTIMIMMAVLNRRAVFAVISTPGWDKLCFETDNRMRLPRGVCISQTGLLGQENMRLAGVVRLGTGA